MSPWVSFERAQSLVAKGGLVVDVRSPAECACGRIPGSLNLPLHQLPHAAVHQLPRDRALLICCESGARSAMAAQYLSQLGFEVHDLGPWSLHADLT
jgi:phage shock protein E